MGCLIMICVMLVLCASLFHNDMQDILVLVLIVLLQCFLGLVAFNKRLVLGRLLHKVNICSESEFHNCFKSAFIRSSMFLAFFEENISCKLPDL